MEILKECPVCKANTFENFLKCKDFTVSQELFQIVHCNSCGLKFTNPRPDTAEIGRYYESAEYISHSNSKKGLINKLYQLVRKRAIQGKLNILEKEVGELKRNILDIGCGTGEFLSICKEKGWETKGIEPNKNARLQGIQNYNLKIEEEGYLDALNDHYSIITLWHVLEHVHKLRERVKQIHDHLSEGGKAIIAVPNYTSADAEKYREYWAAYDVPRHLYHFSPAVIKKLFREEGFKHTRSIAMLFDSYYVSMLSEKYRNGKNNLPSAFLSGLMSNIKASNNPENYSSVIYIFQKEKN